MHQTYEFLFRHRQIERDIMALESKREAIRNCLLPKGIVYDQDKVQTTPSDMMIEVMAQIDEIDRQIEELRKQKLAQINILSGLIESLDDASERAVLMAYYVNGEKIEGIHAKMDKTERQVYRIKKRGVKNLSLEIARKCQ